MALHGVQTWTNQFVDAEAYEWVVTLGMRGDGGTG